MDTGFRLWWLAAQCERQNMAASWEYVSKLARRSEEIGFD